MTYGLPYMGSKSRIAQWIVGLLPASRTLVDLFAGGCAVTHAAMLSGKWDEFVANDITDSALFFGQCCEGEYEPFNPVVDRDLFFATKDADPYARLAFSFGSDQRTYLHNRDIEPFKLQAMRMLVEEDPYARYLAWKRLVRMMCAPDGAAFLFGPDGDGDPVAQLKKLEGVQALERLNRIRRLAALKGTRALACLKTMQGSYRDVEIPDGATVYCDPPYAGTAGYVTEFDHQEFYDWLLSRDFPVYVSEYAMPEGFVRVASRDIRSTLGPNDKAVTEGVYVQERFADGIEVAE